MSKFNYDQPAELFTAKRVGGARQPLTYRRFTTAAEAIRYAIEEITDMHKRAAYMQVGDERFSSEDIRRLYDSNAYPLRRRA